mmetsp:Transcript_18390/g.45938  ORF Transcript_18390/g.45938 Transcript_18390/m.45938 type:complete len:547 (+) Transcript_18390:126-1766(+)|eukprot:CAMPEP_0178994666 /NCGR_PEP_ID=MMETSP0795-20121207/7396_1 /TAXON_ID=88552 /ORGANISM="Amoebophrya sp., Strain Ameob2" /LENGTH=546 /DNA_ID=CAMNT_0020686883 /DNA_START=27 /DNA_END=1667 /DNA_ORIENTATION=-
MDPRVPFQPHQYFHVPRPTGMGIASSSASNQHWASMNRRYSGTFDRHHSSQEVRPQIQPARGRRRTAADFEQEDSHAALANASADAVAEEAQHRQQQRHSPPTLGTKPAVPSTSSTSSRLWPPTRDGLKSGLATVSSLAAAPLFQLVTIHQRKAPLQDRRRVVASAGAVGALLITVVVFVLLAHYAHFMKLFVFHNAGIPQRVREMKKMNKLVHDALVLGKVVDHQGGGGGGTASAGHHHPPHLTYVQRFVFVLLHPMSCVVYFFQSSNEFLTGSQMAESVESVVKAWRMLAMSFLLCMTLWSYVQTVLTKPGAPPAIEETRSGLLVRKDVGTELYCEKRKDEESGCLRVDGAVVATAKAKGARYCKHCSNWKPDRTHHCRWCGACCLRMDHHCPWVNNCVGYRNTKYFVLMLFYATLFALFYCSYLWDFISHHREAVTGGGRQGASDDGSASRAAHFSTGFWLSTIFSFSILLTLCGLLLLHSVGLARDRTTIELLDETKAVRLRQPLVSILGRNVRSWWLPVEPDLPGDGMTWHFKHDESVTSD